MKLGRIAMLVAVMLLTGCATLAFEPQILGGTPLKAPPIYKVWYQEIEDCVGRNFPFWKIRWFVIEDPYFSCGDVTAIGCTSVGSTTQVYLPQVRLDDKETVKHEMIHVVLQGPRGEDSHPEPPFESCEYK